MTHIPAVPQPPLDGVDTEYRTTISAIVARYTQVYDSADYPAALTQARAGLALATSSARTRDQAEFLRSALYVSWLMAESETAQDYGQRLLQCADQLSDDRLRSFAHRVLGSVQRQLGNRTKAREESQIAHDLAKGAQDEFLRIAALNNLGILAFEDNDLTTARRINEEVLAYREKKGDIWDLSGAITNLADVSEQEKDFPAALALQERALALRRQVNHHRGQVRSLFQIAAILRQIGRTDEALADLEEALTRAQKIGGHELLADVYAELARAHEARKDFEPALKYQRLAAREREIYSGDRARNHVIELEVRYGLARQRETIAKLAAERSLQTAELRAREAELARATTQRRVLIYGGIASALALTLIIVLLRSRLHTERRLLAETQAARELAEQADAIKTRFVGIASHDIRGPLTNILHLVTDLQSDHPGSSDTRIDSIISEAQRVLSLVQDLLDTAALETGRLEINRQSINFADIARSALATQRWQAELKRQHLIYNEPPHGLSPYLGDPARLAQVVSNLASNAIKFTPVGKPITVDLSLRGTMLVLAVRDEGPGLTPAQIAKLFQPFARLATQPTGNETSHGLGLSIVHEIVRLHGGTIRVESAPGRGSVFSVELPAA